MSVSPGRLASYAWRWMRLRSLLICLRWELLGGVTNSHFFPTRADKENSPHRFAQRACQNTRPAAVTARGPCDLRLLVSGAPIGGEWAGFMAASACQPPLIAGGRRCTR